ncbi:MAG: hypothetical protein LBR71_00915 [Synergistaceae bacterium]|jgi:hypothetical protein|nr:hypothetical protein [Synergistaceae bacterium]
MKIIERLSGKENPNAKGRKDAAPGGGWSLPKRLLYYAITLVLVVAAGKAYLLWLDYYNRMHPDVVQATAMGYVEEVPLEGVLVWDEQIVPAPRDGILTYPSPLPRRVAKGEAVAAVDGVAVKAETPGYFFPALDGQEGSWVYSRLWPGVSQFPAFEKAKPIENGKHLRAGEPVGKLAPQPQDLRCIAYLDKTVSLERDVKRNFIDIRTEANGKNRRATVRAFSIIGQKIKVYLTLPFFPPSFLSTRAFSCSVLTEDRQGVSVPDTAVTLRDGKQGVLLVQGSMTEFTRIEGFPTDGYNFFITKGVVPGNVVVRYADRVREGVVMLW